MLFFELIKALILGIVEGISEWLPISSTGHLILAEEFIKFSSQNKYFMEMFNVVIQLGAILAVVVIYFKKLNPFQSGKTSKEVKATWNLWGKVIVAVLPAVIIGVPLDDYLEDHFYNFVSVAIVLIFYGIVFIVVERYNRHKKPRYEQLEQLPYRTAFAIGLFQVLSLVPGTSRSGSTILGGILSGTSRYVATEFTFFLGIPVMFGASLLKVFKFIKAGATFSGTEFWILLVACISAFVVSMIVIRMLTDYVKKHDFTFFGKYRIVLGIILLLYVAVRHLVA